MGRRENKQEVHRTAILAILLIQICRCLQIKKNAVPSTREGNSPIQVPLDFVPPAMLVLQLQVKKDGTLPTNPTDYILESKCTGFDDAAFGNV